MRKQTFSLIPFPGSDVPDVQLNGQVGRQNNSLTLQYSLRGETARILLPERSSQPVRRDGLWVTTCFEFFLAPLNDPQYWEFNLSPSGDWNVYRMDAYRRVGFREEMSIDRLQSEAWLDAGCFMLNANIDLSPLIEQNHPIQIGISSVIQTIEKHESYWALGHPDVKADFHNRDSFLIHL